MFCNIQLFCNNQHLLHQKFSHSTSKYLVTSFSQQSARLHHFIYSQEILRIQAIMFSSFMSHRWSYEHFSHDDILIVDLKVDVMKNLNDYYSTYHYVINCKKCDFEMRVDKWRKHYTNLFEIHFRKSFQCFFFKSCWKHVLQEQVRIEKTQTEKTHLIKQRATFQNIKREIELQQQKRRAEIEAVRIVKKQQKIEQTRLKVFACRRCSAKFSSNIKLHIHVQNHHQKKIEKSVANEFAMIASFSFITSNEFVEVTSIAIFASISTFLFTSKAMITMFTFSATSSSSSESKSLLTLSVSHSESISKFSLLDISFVTSKQSFTEPIATSKKSLFWVEMISRSIMTSKFSRFSIFTSKSISTCTKIASIICSSTFFQKSVSKHQHQKFYLIIDDLFEMFVEKRTKSNLIHIKKIEFFSKISHQFKITFYFKFAINQSESITQNSKTSNQRSFQQHTLAKSNRVKFNSFNKWFEKSIILSYKTSIVSRLQISEISNISSYKMSSISRFQSMIAFCKFSILLSISFIIRISFDIFVSCHSCRICSDIFESNNDLHRHLRAIHFDHAFRDESEKQRALERNIMTRKFLIFWRRNRSFFYFFSCITIRFLEEWIACFRHATQRERCDLFSLMTSVTIIMGRAWIDVVLIS